MDRLREAGRAKGRLPAAALRRDFLSGREPFRRNKEIKDEMKASPMRFDRVISSRHLRPCRLRRVFIGDARHRPGPRLSARMLAP